jgi:hypothetical protein
MLIDAAEDRGPMLFARMGMVRALEAHVERTLNPERPAPSQDRGKLKRDRDASIWIQIDITSNVTETPEGFPSPVAPTGPIAPSRTAMSSRALATRSRPAAIFLGYLPYAEVIDPLAGLQFSSQPARRLPSSRPSLGRPIRIPKLRNDGWVWTLPGRRTFAFSFDTTLELLQAIFEYALLREQRCCKSGSDFFVECPQFIRGHRFEVILVHDRPQSWFDVAFIVGKKTWDRW